MRGSERVKLELSSECVDAQQTSPEMSDEERGSSSSGDNGSGSRFCVCPGELAAGLTTQRQTRFHAAGNQRRQQGRSKRRDQRRRNQADSAGFENQASPENQAAAPRNSQAFQEIVRCHMRGRLTSYLVTQFYGSHMQNSELQSRRDDLSIEASPAVSLRNSFRSDLCSRHEVTPKGVTHRRRAVSIDRSSLRD